MNIKKKRVVENPNPIPECPNCNYPTLRVGKEFVDGSVNEFKCLSCNKLYSVSGNRKNVLYYE